MVKTDQTAVTDMVIVLSYNMSLSLTNDYKHTHVFNYMNHLIMSMSLTNDYKHTHVFNYMNQKGSTAAKIVPEVNIGVFIVVIMWVSPVYVRHSSHLSANLMDTFSHPWIILPCNASNNKCTILLQNVYFVTKFSKSVVTQYLPTW